MATVKIKFRVSSIETKAGTLYYQVIHNRLVKQVHFGYKLYPSEWDADCSRVIPILCNLYNLIPSAVLTK